ncbi:photosystem P840 reaction-center cytochrome c-551 [Prosthecochloris sp. N3]|uniref:Photosystem P840 reaction-center cytochrome c-551 n=1 Tax=Prosthecochloris ethylica TaxID=2743976 RepID=A0ABR9XQL4_9CHLB|nr:photosystem P840 reaction-center cytochrome c-551 [Prosthecochloris ethylica]MBF0586502.1 photosystem P840 reaction-center cytochrome c-551 [Prosthecochloris ethylica]MBF0636115.1 photosystem P840 reaction-center cytochrome c-551 [Prosthecochloris ethylica]NUK47748.1 photosystem P840 reaction-center cytochrome c-551 [Prosthecochloris ethylica]
MDNNSNGKLIALAIGGAVLMGALFFGSSFLTGYELPAENFSKIATPLQSFMGWFLLIFCSSLIIWGLGRMSSRISDKWFLSFPLSIFVIVAVMFVSLEVVWEKGRTTTLDGESIRTVRQLSAFNEGVEDFIAVEDLPEGEMPVEEETGPLPVVILTGDELAGAEKVFVRNCSKCHSIKSVENSLAQYRKKGEAEKIVREMKAVPNSGIRSKDVATIVNYINSTF